MQFIKIAMLFLSLAHAEDASKPAALTYEQVESVLAGLMGLDKGTDQIAKDGAQEHVVHHAFNLGEGLRVQNGLLEARLLDADRTYTQAKNALVRQYADGGDKVPDKNRIEFEAAAQKLAQTSSGLVPPHFKMEELKLKDNPDITSSIIALLQPIIDETSQ
jgi:hypothetical protein